ncbi:MAG: DoxX family protein [Mycobacteriaceae bacterium]|uniref:DoxX family protein n=1 Tax=Corynebacterium sp. TaxID=1720 RepID=UPI003F97302A
MGLFEKDPNKDPGKDAVDGAVDRSADGARDATGIDADLFDEIDVPDAPGEPGAPSRTVSQDADDTQDVPVVPETTEASGDGDAGSGSDGGAGADSADSGDTAADPESAASPETETETDPEPERPKRDIYEMAGRAKPQRIEPRRAEPEPEPEPAPTPQDPTADAEADDSRTEVFAASDREDRAYREPIPASTAGAADSAPDDDADQTTALLGAAGVGAAGAGAAGVGAAGAAGDAGAPETTTFPAGDATSRYDEAATPADPDPADAAVADEGAGVVGEPRRGTLDFGLLILRLVAGALLIVRGLQTLFAFGGDPGISALEQTLAAYNFADILAVAIPVAQIVAGGLLVFGLLTPLGGAVAIVVAGFLTLHNLSLWDSGYWPYALSPAVQFWAAVALIGLVLTFTGPGRYSADISRGWATRPLASAWIFALVGAGAAAALWIAVGGGNPF